jgi:hypothetical protein
LCSRQVLCEQDDSMRAVFSERAQEFVKISFLTIEKNHILLKTGQFRFGWMTQPPNDLKARIGGDGRVKPSPREGRPSPDQHLNHAASER